MSEKDIQERFVAVSKSCWQQSETVDVLAPPVATDNAEMTTLYLFPIIQVGAELHHYWEELNLEGRELALLSW